MSYESTVTSKGQITIPKGLRKKYELRRGEKVVLIPSEDGIVLKHRVNDLRRIRGILKEEVDLEKAAKFIRKLRMKCRVE